MRDLFARIEETKDKFETHVELSFVEIYNEQIRDLLSDKFPITPTGGLKLLENEKERVTIADVTSKEPKSVEDVLELVVLGNERRSTSSTNANNQSSRSHAVLQVNVSRASRAADVDMDREAVLQDTFSATLSIVDLAGSERASATHNMGTRMKEGAKINQSLLALSSCISALCLAQKKGSKPHVPYRNSKLTRLLKFSLGGNCRTVMIVCVSPSSKDMEDTSNTLTWANKAKDVKMRITRNVGGHEVSTRQYLEKIAEQAERIRLLEVQLEKKEAALQTVSVAKLEEGRKRIAETIRPINCKIDDKLAEIRRGAEYRARWDAANLASKSLADRRDGFDVDCDDEKKFCDTIIKLFDDAYGNSRNVQNIVRRERDHVTDVENTLASAASKTFTEMDVVNAQNLQLQVELQRSRYLLAIADAREIGYRASLACSQESLADCAAAFLRIRSQFSQYQGSHEELLQRGNVPKEALEKLMDVFTAQMSECEDAIIATFRASAKADSQPTVSIPIPTVNQSPSPVKAPTPVISVAHAPLNVSINGAHSSPRSAGVKRVLAATEGKGVYPVGSGSPRGAPTSPKPAKVKSGVRWGDDSGEAGLEKVRTFNVDTSQSDMSIKVDNSAEWDEVKDELKPLAKAPLRGAMRVPSLTSSPAPFSVTTTTAAPVTPALSVSLPPSTSSSEADFDSWPEWKKNRYLLGKAGAANAGNTSVGDTSTSPTEPPTPVASGKVTPIGMGKPSRPPSRTSVLGELHQIPPSSGRSSLTSSTLHHPTAASAARSTPQEKQLAPTEASPLAQSTSAYRRTSVSRRERSKLHKGGVPYRRKPSLIPSPNGSPDTSISPRGGSSGIPLSASTMRTLGKPVRLRDSMMAGNTSINGESARPLRHSISISTLQQPGLRPRPSMIGLNSGVQASRPAWK